jgi:hypothetical protein
VPFTLAHPAVILLLPRNRYLQVLPLVAGSLAPDLTYFLPERLTRLLPNCHQLPGATTGLSVFVCLYVLGGFVAASHERRARASSAF